ncbi:MAG: hypothetical protein JST55_02855 [Bacteroidetes bacterium]|nr:hypothetical protein [Bacteroidota bacterium]
MKKPSSFLAFLITGIISLSIFINSNAFSQGGATVTTTPPTDNAKYLSQSTPGVMESGKSYDATISMKNSGSTTWQKGNYKLRLMNQTEALSKIWGISDLDLGSNIAPGESVTFSLTLKSPETPGDYNLQWQMANGNAFFGEPTANIPVKVVGPETTPQPKNDVNYNSTYKYNNFPAEVSEGGVYDIVITMRNTGATGWNPSEDHLKLTTSGINDTKNTWTIADVNLPETVVAGGEYSFAFKLTAPQESGEYSVQAQMVHKDVPFGEPSPVVQIKVK